jgi:hypothetical protein
MAQSFSIAPPKPSTRALLWLVCRPVPGRSERVVGCRLRYHAARGLSGKPATLLVRLGMGLAFDAPAGISVQQVSLALLH